MYKRYIIIIVLIKIFFPTIINAEEERIKIQGEYSQAIGENENPDEVKYICYNNALRNAVLSAPDISSELAGIDNENIIKELVQVFSTGYLKELKIFEEEKENVATCKIEAYIQPEEFKKAAAKEIYRIRRGTRGIIDQNELLKILAVIPRNGKVELVFKLLRKGAGEMQFNSIGEIYFDGLTLSKITIEYFAANRAKIKEERKYVDKDSKVYEIKSLFLEMPPEAKFCLINLEEKGKYANFQ